MKPIAAVLLCVCSIVGLAQKNDYTWISGYGSYYSNADSIARGWKFGHSIFDFNVSPVNIAYDSLGMDIAATNTTFSDNDGNLLFYTNGVWIANNQHRKIYKGDSLNEGWLMTSFDPSIRTGGYRLPQGIIALPDINNANQYRLLHSLVDSLAGSNEASVNTPKILSTHLDMDANFLGGELLSKNIPIFQGNFGGELSAVRHGNGRDWWILQQNRGTSCFGAILYDSIGFHTIDNIGCGDITVENGEIGGSAFSPDGSIFGYVNYSGGLEVFGFERCNGRLTQIMSVPIERCLGISFSPNNRYVYVTASVVLLQFDMWASDISASMDTVGIYDGYYLNGFPSIKGLFKTPQLAPDGKIYIVCPSATDVYHVINNPDEKGSACNFVQHGVKLPGLARNIPNYPNYRLGALPGSACDTLTSVKDIAEKEKILKVFPNPANDVATIDYGYTDWSKGETSMEITNSLGQTVHNQTLPMYSGFQKLQVANYPSGSYTVYIKRKGNIVAAGRLVKE